MNFEKISSNLKKLNSSYDYYIKNKTIYMFFLYIILIAPFAFTFFHYLHILNKNISTIIMFTYGGLIVYLPSLILQIIDDYIKTHESFPLISLCNDLFQTEKDYLKNNKIIWGFIFIILLRFFCSLIYIIIYNVIDYSLLYVFPNIITIFSMLIGIGLSIFFTDFFLLIKNKLNFKIKNSFWSDLCQIEKDYLKNKKTTWIFLFLFLLILFSFQDIILIIILVSGIFYSHSLIDINNSISFLISNLFLKGTIIFSMLIGIGLSMFFTDLILLIKNKLDLLIFKKNKI